MDKIRLGERLIQEGAISPAQLAMALKEQVRTGELLGEVIRYLGYASRENIKRALAKNADIDFISLKEIKVHADILKLVPKAFVLRHKVLPLGINNSTLQVAMSDPFDVLVIDELQSLTGYVVQVVTATDEDINQALDSFYYTSAITLKHKPLNQQEIDELVKKVAGSDNPITIHGERCTGRDLLALTIHSISPRRRKPFIVLDCTATPPTQLEGELFGYEKGFIQSVLREGKAHKGKLELAEGGTLFIDEIGDMPLSAQTKVLRALLTGEFERVGSTEARKINVRIIAATSNDLEMAIEEGLFNKDLYFRLNTIPIELVPLQERKADIPLWAGFFLEKIRHKMSRPDLRLSEGAIWTLMEYHWPGHLVELESCLERAALVAEGELINRDNLPI
ncbi:MAG TPA: sigma 54-interacting transcriptional regulator [Candidatus Tripitaka californicus]|uniref:sigma 54-interacting transcriptional regulator n=2 Tax=Candidatus Tripitaka californicus TaxID=3367616 RepID=UPI00402940A4|nr:sigma 54-interacting transcriptional regulator [Planctomycetota bacterium]